ncbi:hypothetical protein QTO34_017641 [Cnephaeus nilssonii]|uniref:RING-type domain-containing protein n=1 Tax=Cnephaeus nilssonii TaxID=3371016 RepID=A0AA40I1D9_CNENI|nr:hypothetical protein QTO34_017641 [Eptesicus nilssonii]
MKKKTVYTLNVGDQKYEDMEGEEDKDNAATTGLLYSEADRCPICLNCLLEKEVGFPESCNHVFCMSCILKWAETQASCPIDRKPFQAVFKISALEGCVKVQVKRQLREAKDKINESSFKKQLSCHENSKSCMRKNIVEDLLSAKLYDLKMHIHSSPVQERRRGVASPGLRAAQSTDHTLCAFPCGHFSQPAFLWFWMMSHMKYLKVFMKMFEIIVIIEQSRDEFNKGWSRTSLSGKIIFIYSSFTEQESWITWKGLPLNIYEMSLSFLKFIIECGETKMAETQGSHERQSSPTTLNSTGETRDPQRGAPRVSTSGRKADSVNESELYLVENGGYGCPPGAENPKYILVLSSNSRKQGYYIYNNKSLRRSNQCFLLIEKRISSFLKSETDLAQWIERRPADSRVPVLVERNVMSKYESEKKLTVDWNSSNIVLFPIFKFVLIDFREERRMIKSHQTVPLKSLHFIIQPIAILEQKANKTGPQTEVYEETAESDTPPVCSEQIEESEEHTENHDTEEKVESSYSESCIQDPPILIGEEEDVQKVENTGIEEIKKVENAESDISKTISKEGEIVVNEEKVVEVNEEKVTDVNDQEGEIIQTVDKTSIEISEIQLPGHVEIGGAEVMCDTSGNENFNSIQDSESNLLKSNLNTKLDTSLEEKAESLVEHPRSTELPNTHIEQIQKHFSEDNNEMIPMECDSFCSDQNESGIELSVNTDAKQLNKNSAEHSSQNNMPSSDPVSEKVETVSQPFENPIDMIDKAKKPRTRRSRFHSPSTTWSPNRDTSREKKRSQSPSPKRETGKESRKSRSPSPKKESSRGRRKSRSQSPRKDIARERRQSQSRSPKRDSTREGKKSESLSPKRDTSRENRRSQSRVKDSSPTEKSRSRSRERESDRDGPRRERERDRERRTRRWSRSRSRSRSPSRSRTKSKSSSFGRNDRDSYSPRWKERWANDGWRCPRGNDRYRKNDLEKQNENTRKEKNDISPDADDPNSADKHRNDCSSWVTETINSGPDPRTRHPEKLKDSPWEENRNENSGNTWNKNFGSGWMSNRGRGNRGRGTYRGNFAYSDQNENRWQNRKPLSGNSNGSGNESFKFVEQQPYKRKSEQEFSFDTPADRSGWTSASSWAVRKTLPADVQNYYSRRGRNSSGSQSGWMRQEEETPEQDSNLKDQTNQQGDGSQLPINMMQPQMNVMQQQMNAQHQPMNIFPYPMGVHAPLMNIQRNPFNIHPQLPLHLHTGVPLMQVAAPTGVSQGLPPPPPPPPPSQQVNYIASQPDGKQLQGIPGASHVTNNMSTPVLPAPTAAPANMETVQGPSSGNASSSSHSKASNAAVKLAESKKLQIQEKAAQEVKLAIKPFYQNKDITKEEYKEIVRKAVDKVCHSKSGEVNSTKVANLVKAYVDKYKYSRKGSQKKTLEEPLSTEKNIG